MEVYECQKCEEWFAEALRPIIVHRYETVRLQNHDTFVIDNRDMIMVCQECHGAYLEVDSKVGFVQDV